MKNISKNIYLGNAILLYVIYMKIITHLGCRTKDYIWILSLLGKGEPPKKGKSPTWKPVIKVGCMQS